MLVTSHCLSTAWPGRNEVPSGTERSWTKLRSLLQGVGLARTGVAVGCAAGRGVDVADSGETSGTSTSPAEVGGTNNVGVEDGVQAEAQKTMTKNTIGERMRERGQR